MAERAYGELGVSLNVHWRKIVNLQMIAGSSSSSDNRVSTPKLQGQKA
jgi:hypothetical protein